MRLVVPVYPALIRRGFALSLVAVSVGVLTPDHVVHAQDAAPRHRVVVSTGVSDREADVDASLERHVNRLAGAGYELMAILGGASQVVDSLLTRKPYVAGLVDHSGHTAIVMSRAPEGQAVRRE